MTYVQSWVRCPTCHDRLHVRTYTAGLDQIVWEVPHTQMLGWCRQHAHAFKDPRYLHEQDRWGLGYRPTEPWPWERLVERVTDEKEAS
jgi:hypothetical protein